MLLRKIVSAALLLVVLAGLGAADRRDGELLACPGKKGNIYIFSANSLQRRQVTLCLGVQQAPKQKTRPSPTL